MVYLPVLVISVVVMVPAFVVGVLVEVAGS
jgi:hypothetical protein